MQAEALPKQSRYDEWKLAYRNYHRASLFSDVNAQLLVPNGNWLTESSPIQLASKGDLAFDGYLKTFYQTDAGSKASQWIQVDLGVEIKVGILFRLLEKQDTECGSLQAIYKIVLFKPIGHPQKATHVEVRVGNKRLLSSSNGQEHIKVNKMCGKSSNGHKANTLVEFDCLPALDGQFVSLQSMKEDVMNIGELSIFKSGRHL